MDCCNYVEAYTGGGHFYQQQNYFCYDNGGYGGYEPLPISGAIESGARYSGTMSPAYPTDYVYNPKEARLRKAMREQSRELSRRSILQNAIARAGVIGGPVSSAGFLDHQHRFGCVTATGLPINSPVDSDRVAEPWFQSSPRPKTIHSPNWYGNVADPIERLQVMGTMHQRNIDKCKDIIRNQANASTGVSAECAFSNSGYSGNFSDVNRENELHRQENMVEYSEIDGQKWHPYQNGGSHQHSRTPHSSQVGGLLHSNVQAPSSHGHGPWGQFCHGVIPHAPAMPPNIGLRGPRHTVLLRDHMPTRHCGFSEEISRLTYPPGKVDVDSVRASYTPPEHQIPRLLESSVDSVMDSSTPRTRHEDEGSRWEPNNINNGIPMDNLASTTQQESNVSREKDRESRRFDRFDSKKKSASKQPLPGFHQAFGSTEIGRFSRSEFFVNMVGESGGGAVEVGDAENSNRLSKSYLSAPVILPFLPRSCGILGAATTIHGIAENGDILSRIIPNECCWFSRSRYGMSRISDNVMNCTAFLNCSHHTRDKEWFCQGNAMVHPAELQAALRQKENCVSFANERIDRDYVVIGTASRGNRNIPDNIVNDGFDSDAPKQMTLKIETDGSLKYSNVQLNVSPAKSNEGVQ